MKSRSPTGGEMHPWDPESICTPDGIALLQRYSELLGDFGRRLNLVSRESLSDRWVRHVLHSLCLGFRSFPGGSCVVDWGTGGGLPLIPLAVAFPDVRFVGVEAVGKKVMAVRSIVRRLCLNNVEVVQARAEAWDGNTDYSVSRATASLATLWGWHRRVARQAECEADGEWPCGLICLQGGDLGEEVREIEDRYPSICLEVIPLAEVAAIAQFVGKHIVVVTRAT